MEEEGKIVIERVWDKGALVQNNALSIHHKLERCRGELSKWSYSKERDPNSDIAMQTEKLRQELLVEVPHNVGLIWNLQEKLGLFLENEDIK